MLVWGFRLIKKIIRIVLVRAVPTDVWCESFILASLRLSRRRSTFYGDYEFFQTDVFPSVVFVLLTTAGEPCASAAVCLCVALHTSAPHRLWVLWT